MKPPLLLRPMPGSFPRLAARSPVVHPPASFSDLKRANVRRFPMWQRGACEVRCQPNWAPCRNSSGGGLRAQAQRPGLHVNKLRLGDHAVQPSVLAVGSCPDCETSAATSCTEVRSVVRPVQVIGQNREVIWHARLMPVACSPESTAERRDRTRVGGSEAKKGPGSDFF
jgi:hypothetical protein